MTDYATMAKSKKPTNWKPGVRLKDPLAKGLVALWPLPEARGFPLVNVLIPKENPDG